MSRTGRLSPSDRAKIERVAEGLSAVPLLDLPQLLVASTGEGGELGFTAEDGSGAIIGDVFAKNRRGRIMSLTPQDTAALVASRGRDLYTSYWGDFVAFIADANGVCVLRSPFGERSLCWFETPDAIFLASDLQALAACGGDMRSIDWRAVARHLAEPDIRRGATCLSGVNELRGGDRLCLRSRAVEIETVWTPWSLDADLSPPVNRLRAAIDDCVADKVARYDRPLLLLSGGLDSSILAAALAGAGKDVVALNFVTQDRSGDERVYARLAAATFGIAYREELRQIANVDISRSDATWLPRPALRSFLQDSRMLTEQTAREAGCDVIIEGSGGDNVFCSLQSVAPVADRLRCGGSPAAVLGSARDIARLTDATLLTVLRRAVHRAWFRSVPYRAMPDHSFLTPRGVEQSHGATAHPWLTRSPRALPGKVAHAAMLVAAQGWVECLDPLATPRTLGPLLAQPIVEACFATPSWRWFADGQNRVVAREAYRGRLPDRILDRRSKATPDSFVTQLYNRNRMGLAELLLDGQLVREGFLDRMLLERELRRDGPPLDHLHRRIMRIADVEAWLAERPTASASASFA